MRLVINVTKFKRARQQFIDLTEQDTLRAVNMAGHGIKAVMAAFTPVRTGQTRRALRVRATRSMAMPMVVGFFAGARNTAFVARLLEYGTGPRYRGVKGGRKRRVKVALELERANEGALNRKFGYSGRGPKRPIVAPTVPLAPSILEAAFRRVFGERKAKGAAALRTVETILTEDVG